MVNYCKPLDVKFAAQVKSSQLEFSSDSDFETYLENKLIPAAMLKIDGYVGHNFQSNGSTTVRVDGSGSNVQFIHPPFLPVLSISAVVVDGINITSLVKIYPPSNPCYIKSNSNVFTKNRNNLQNVEITLTYGYVSVPEDLAEACAQLCANALQRMLKMKMMPDLIAQAVEKDSVPSGLLSSPKVFTSDIREVLDSYVFSFMDVC